MAVHDGIAPPSRVAPLVLAAALVGAGATAAAVAYTTRRSAQAAAAHADQVALELLAAEAFRAFAELETHGAADGPPAGDSNPAVSSAPGKARRGAAAAGDGGKGAPIRAAPERTTADDPTGKMEAFLAQHGTLDGIRVRGGNGALWIAGRFPPDAHRLAKGHVEVAATDPAGDTHAHPESPAVPDALAWAAAGTVCLFAGLGLWLRRRLLALSEVAVGVAAGRFDDLPALRGHDEFAWIARTLHETADLVREQIERVRGRNAHLLRDLALQGDHLERLSAYAAKLVAPLTGNDPRARAVEHLARDVDAVFAVLYEVGHDGRFTASAAAGVDRQTVRAHSGAALASAARERRDCEGPKTHPPLDPDDPWMRAVGRQIPLEGVVTLPLWHAGRLEGVVALASRYPPGPHDLAFLADVAHPLAIFLSNLRAFRTQRHLARSLAERNDALLRQRDELDALNRLRREFVANISHELRTPLGAVIGYAELLADGVYGPIHEPQREAVEGILETARHLLTLVNQVLDLSRAEHDLSPKARPCNLYDVCDEAVRMCGPMAQHRPYEVRLNGPRDVVLETDPEYVRQVLINLVGNAIKFTEEGEVVVDLRPRPDGGVEIAVRDTGVGIAAEDLEIVFEAFRQVDGSSTRAADGAGLGLAISRRIARALGGDLHVSSRPGHGSVFTLSLPETIPNRESPLELAEEAA